MKLTNEQELLILNIINNQRIDKEDIKGLKDLFGIEIKNMSGLMQLSLDGDFNRDVYGLIPEEYRDEFWSVLFDTINSINGTLDLQGTNIQYIAVKIVLKDFICNDEAKEIYIENISGNAKISNAEKLKELDIAHVGGNLYIKDCDRLHSFDSDITVDGTLYLDGLNMENFDFFNVKGSLTVYDCKIKKLGNIGSNVGMSLTIGGSKINMVRPKNIGGLLSIDIKSSADKIFVETLGGMINQGGHVGSFPLLISVEGDLYAGEISDLPFLESVRGNLIFLGNVNNIRKLEYVGGRVILNKRYTKLSPEAESIISNFDVVWK